MYFMALLWPLAWLEDYDHGSPWQGRLSSGWCWVSTPRGAMLLLMHWHALESQYVSFLCSQAALTWKGEIVSKCWIYCFLTSPNCQTGHSQSHVTILKRPGDRETSHDQPQSLPQILCVSYNAASFLPFAPNVTPIIAGEMVSFSKELEPIWIYPHPILHPRFSVISEWTLARGMRQFSSLISSISPKFRQLWISQ